MDQKEIPDLSHVLAPENQHETITLARVLCPFAEAATDELILICVALVEAKGDPKAVADWLGFSKSRVTKHIQSSLSSRILRELTKNKLTGEGYVKAVSALMDIASSESQSGNARRQAAESLLRINEEEEQKTKGKAGANKDLNELSLHELESLVRSVKNEITALPSAVTPASPNKSSS